MNDFRLYGYISSKYCRLLPTFIAFHCMYSHLFLFLLHPDLVLKTGITIPAGTLVVVPVKLVQMDNSSWGSDANEFNPYRFLSMACNGTDTTQRTSLAGMVLHA